jgi:Sec7-like guanine-nucleotide exchange factor
VDNQGSDEEES